MALPFMLWRPRVRRAGRRLRLWRACTLARRSVSGGGCPRALAWFAPVSDTWARRTMDCAISRARARAFAHLPFLGRV